MAMGSNETPNVQSSSLLGLTVLVLNLGTWHVKSVDPY